jgi:hypothetical protein
MGAGVTVPASAITLNGTHHAVFVQVQPGVFEQRDVSLAYQGPKEVVVSRGLQAGEQVVADNALLLARQFHVAQEDSIGRGAAPEAGAKRPPRPRGRRDETPDPVRALPAAVHRAGHPAVCHGRGDRLQEPVGRGLSRRHRHPGHGDHAVPGPGRRRGGAQVTLPIEVALSGLPNSIRVFSHTQFGLSFMVVTFDDKADVNLVRQQVGERLRSVDLPAGVEAEIAPNATPVGEIMRYRLRGDG